MGGKIFSILLIVAGLGVVVFLARSGAVEGLFKAAGNSILRPRAATSTLASEKPLGEIIPGASATRPKETSENAPPAQKSVSSPTAEGPKIDPRRLPEGFTLEDVSRYARAIDLSVGRSLITLRAVFSGPSAIDVTGWTLKSMRRGTTLIVPQAVNIYDPSGLAQEGDILLRAGELLKIHAGQSAIGINFRLNKCTGYLENFNDFSPSLPKSCPNPEGDFDLSKVSGACQDYIRSLSYCSLPKGYPNVPAWDYSCENYIDEINFSGCYRRHRFDSDFLSKEWWAWSRQSFTDPNHDTILLLDKEGKLVDGYAY